MWCLAGSARLWVHDGVGMMCHAFVLLHAMSLLAFSLVLL